MGRSAVAIIVIAVFIAGSVAFTMLNRPMTQTLPAHPTVPEGSEGKGFQAQTTLNPHQAALNAAKQPAAKIDFDSIPDVIAEIDGQPLKKDIYVRTLKALEKNLNNYQRNVDEQTLKKVQNDILNNIIDTQAMLKQAQNDNIVVDAAEIEKNLAQLKSNFPDQKVFESTLAAQGLTEADLETEITKKLTTQALLDKKVLENTDVTDQEVRDYYDLNQLEFETPEKARVAHILARAGQEATEEQKKTAREKIDKIHTKLKEGGDFAELAKAESEDPGTAPRGGELGPVRRDQLVPEFSKAAFALEPGEFSGVVESRYGYHIIKVTDKEAPRLIPFEEAKEKIKSNLIRRKSDQKVRDYVQDLRKKFNTKLLL